jgi:histidyl-tRNA synthetase
MFRVKTKTDAIISSFSRTFLLQALELFAELRENGLKELEGEEREKFERQTRWAERKGNKHAD